MWGVARFSPLTSALQLRPNSHLPCALGHSACTSISHIPQMAASSREKQQHSIANSTAQQLAALQVRLFGSSGTSSSSGCSRDSGRLQPEAGWQVPPLSMDRPSSGGGGGAGAFSGGSSGSWAERLVQLEEQLCRSRSEAARRDVSCCADAKTRSQRLCCRMVGTCTLLPAAFTSTGAFAAPQANTNQAQTLSLRGCSMASAEYSKCTHAPIGVGQMLMNSTSHARQQCRRTWPTVGPSDAAPVLHSTLSCRAGGVTCCTGEQGAAAGREGDGAAGRHQG